MTKPLSYNGNSLSELDEKFHQAEIRREKERDNASLNKCNKGIKKQLNKFNSIIESKDNSINFVKWIGIPICVIAIVGAVIAFLNDMTIGILIVPIGMVIVLRICKWFDDYGESEHVNKRIKEANQAILEIQKAQDRMKQTIKKTT